MPQCDENTLICSLAWWLFILLPILIVGTMFFGGAAVLQAIGKLRFNYTMRKLDKNGVETVGMIIRKNIVDVPFHRGTHMIAYVYRANEYRFETEAYVSEQDWLNLERDTRVTVTYLPNKPNVSRLKDFKMYA
jgi:hypothetical protein